MAAGEYRRHESEKNGVEYFRVGEPWPTREDAERDRAAHGRWDTTVVEGSAESLLQMLGEGDVFELQGKPIPAEHPIVPIDQRWRENMENDVYAAFIHLNGSWERRSGIRENPDDLRELRKFCEQDDFMRATPETDKDIFRGPRNLISQTRIPGSALENHVRSGQIRIMEIGAISLL